MIEAALAVLRPQLEPPLYEWSSAAALPASAGLVTMLIRDVDRLSADQQQTVLAWLDGAERRHQVQVVSIAETDPYPLIERGVFLRRLYYRLNMLRFDASTLTPDGA
jgi:DNA-binding NtrC family response regulator